MSKLRKLQIEIEQTLKRLNEGLADFDKLWDKLEETEDPSQRDKIVNEMKRELKKLQRLRELVRGWAASGEVKDDSRLTDARKAVEREMERFKGLERELKIKQFSWEGLMRDSTDPVMVAKVQCADWINDAVTQLETQVEQFEADLEALGPHKGGRGKPPRVAELEGFIRRHQEHVTRLEQVLRLLENDQVSPDEVEGALRDGIDYYLASSTETDFVADDSMYDSLPLKEIDDSIGKITAHTPRAPAKGKDDGETGEGAPEGGKTKRGKGGKGGKAKGGEAKGGAAAQATAAAGKPAVPPPPGLPPPPSSPMAATTPSAVTRSASFKAAVATGATKPAAPSPSAAAATEAAVAGPQGASLPIQQSVGGPETPAQTLQAAAATTPPGALHPVPTTPITAPPAALPSPQTTPLVAVDSSASTQAPVTTPEAAGVAAGPQQAQQEPPVAVLAPPPSPRSHEPLSPASAARLGTFNEQMLLAATAHHAEQQARLQQAQQAQQPGSPAVRRGVPPSMPVLGVPPGLPQLAVPTAAPGPLLNHTGGHSPLAALANAASAAAAAAAAAASNPMAAHQFSADGGLPLSHHLLPRLESAGHGAFGLADTSPRSVHSSASAGGASSEAEARRRAAADAASAAAAAEFAAAAAAATAAGTAISPLPRDMQRAASRGVGIPTVLSFNHLQSQAESVLGLGGETGAAAPASAEEALLAAGGQGGAAGSEGEGPRGAPGAPQLPWAPTLLDLHLLEASVHTWPQPGDADWPQGDGAVSAAGTPPPAKNPVVTPASFPNQVHPSLRRDNTFSKLSAETCFFAFYFQQGTRQQLFAANALKNAGWRFHTQFNAWFARQSQPRVVTETHEQGPLIYFDSLLHNATPTSPSLLPSPLVYSGWCPRVSRPDFMFEYKFMENEDTRAPSDP